VKKYVDDIIVSLPEEDIEICQTILNSFHPRLMFTTEKEFQSSIPFLDMRLSRNTDCTINTDWYEKPTSCHRLLNYYSSHPKFMIENVGLSFTSRILTLSDSCYHSANKIKIQKILSKNNYPERLIRKLIYKAVSKLQVNNNINPNQNLINNNNNNIIAYSKLPFIAGLTNKIQKEFKIKNDNIKFGLKPYKKVYSIFTNTKSKIPHFRKSDLVYKIQCEHPNCDKVYIGETSQHLKERVDQHKNDVSNRHRNIPKTALVEHVLHHESMNNGNPTSFSFDFEGTKILTQESNTQRRKLAEAAQIWLHNDCAINIKKDTKNLRKTYFSTVKKFGKK
jgi:hypothetical protein